MVPGYDGLIGGRNKQKKGKLDQSKINILSPFLSLSLFLPFNDTYANFSEDNIIHLKRSLMNAGRKGRMKTLSKSLGQHQLMRDGIKLGITLKNL